MKHEEKERAIKTPTGNEWFHASEGVYPLTVLCEFEPL